jgi:hypothetical protein
LVVIEVNVWEFAGAVLGVLIWIVLIVVLPVSLTLLAVMVDKWWWGALLAYVILMGWRLFSIALSAVKDLPPSRVSPRWLRRWARGQE